MAYKIMPVYNIHDAVGRRKANRPDDVRLVQAMLIELSRRDNWTPAEPLSVNGVWSDVMRSWIIGFQQRINRDKPRTLKVDGKIHPMPMMSTFDWSGKFRSGVTSTLYFMNKVYRAYNRSLHDNLSQRLGLQEDLPDWSKA